MTMRLSLSGAVDAGPGRGIRPWGPGQELLWERDQIRDQ